jgi:hypothetical protein
MKSFHHNLSTGLVTALVKAIRFVQANNKNKFHLQKDLKELTKNEYNNFQKLRFHGLVAKIHDKSGYWLITRRGGQFLRGEITVPWKVETFRNRVIGHSPEQVHIKDLRGKLPEFEKDFSYEYQPVEYLQNIIKK